MAPPSAKKPASFAYRSRFAIVLGVIGAFYIITPLSYLYLAYRVTTTYIPSFHRYGPNPPSGPFTFAFYYLPLAYSLAEVIFSVIYRYLAFSINIKRFPTSYHPRELRDVVKRVLESDMSPVSDDASVDLSTAAAAADANNATRRRQRQASHDSALDSGYASSASSSCSPSRRGSTSYNFIEGKLAHDDPRAHDFRETARSWFFNKPFEAVWREDASQWMSWSLYGQPYEEVVRERRNSVSSIDGIVRQDDIGRDKQETVDYSVDLWEARAGVKLKEGKNPDVSVVRLTLDEAKVVQRPLLLYGLVWIAQQVYFRKLAKLGFETLEFGGLRYLIKTPKGWTPSEDEDKRPVLFLHGLGLGPVQYATIINKLSKDSAFRDRPLAILLQPHLSMSIFDPAYLNPPDSKKCVSSFVNMVKSCNFDSVGMTVLSHSNGTTVHGWILKEAPELVKRSCFVDPVCFALWEPALPFNFLYSNVRSPMQALMRYFVSRELGVANLLQRRFDWISNILFPEDIPNLEEPGKASVFLSEKDTIVDTPRISKYLAAEGMQEGEGLKIFKKEKHGESMMGHKSSFGQVMDWVKNVN
ncbi:hypothetical protein MNV49_005632 [Pseudohyphozyma bogoriensis]|nr:hypothetical protein MNV49_005632 [Pseudohyphozyma bogoriensis]